MQRLGTILKRARGRESRVQFARRLGLSYTFVRAMEHGQRFPSDKVLLDIAGRLGLEPTEFLLAAWCDRSPDLDRVLRELGVHLPAAGSPERPENGDAVQGSGAMGNAPEGSNGHPGHSLQAGESQRALG